jgi:hypothetical protein
LCFGYIYQQNGELQQAMSTWMEVYKIAKQIGLAEALDNLENLAKQLGGDGLAYWKALSQTTPEPSSF